MADLQHIQRLLQQPFEPDHGHRLEPAVASSFGVQCTGVQHAFRKRRKLPRPESDAARDHGGGLPVSPLYSPGKRSTSSAWHCETCQVWIVKARQPGEPESRHCEWRTHIEGIRHRRNVLSRVHAGDTGAVIVSTFESCSGQRADPLFKRTCATCMLPLASPPVGVKAEAIGHH